MCNIIDEKIVKIFKRISDRIKNESGSSRNYDKNMGKRESRKRSKN